MRRVGGHAQCSQRGVAREEVLLLLLSMAIRDSVLLLLQQLLLLLPVRPLAQHHGKLARRLESLPRVLRQKSRRRSRRRRGVAATTTTASRQQLVRRLEANSGHVDVDGHVYRVAQERPGVHRRRV